MAELREDGGQVTRFHMPLVFLRTGYLSPRPVLKYTMTMLIPKSDPSAKNVINKAIEFVVSEAVQTKWNGAAPTTLITPLHDGDGLRPNGEPYGPEAAGCFVMAANSKQKPEIVDMNLQPIVNDQEIYSGVWVYVSVNFFAYLRSGKKGIGCGLNAVMKFKDDEPLGGRITARKAFAGIIKPAVLDGAAQPYNPVSPPWDQQEA